MRAAACVTTGKLRAPASKLMRAVGGTVSGGDGAADGREQGKIGAAGANQGRTGRAMTREEGGIPAGNAGGCSMPPRKRYCTGIQYCSGGLHACYGGGGKRAGKCLAGSDLGERPRATSIINVSCQALNRCVRLDFFLVCKNIEKMLLSSFKFPPVAPPAVVYRYRYDIVHILWFALNF